MNPMIRRGLGIGFGVLGAYFAVQYLLPLALPFLLGAALALAAEPLVGFLNVKVRLPRPLAAGIGVSLALAVVILTVSALFALLIRQLQNLAGILPDMENTLQTGLDAISGWLTDMVRRAPEGLRLVLLRQIDDLFSGGTALLDRVTAFVLTFATGVLSKIPGGALLTVTGILSGFMISAKYPKIRAYVKKKLPVEKLAPGLHTLKGLKSAVVGWLKAQLKLCGMTFLVVAAGLMLLRISHGILWALVIGVVDALPVLGAGAALIPWSLVSFLQGDRGLAFGLLGVYAAVAVTRTVLEPRLVGRQLGLDPLVTLAALYIGYRLWGIGGMILAPLLAVAVTQMTEVNRGRE